MNKKEVRKIIRERRENLSKEYIEKASDIIFQALSEDENFKNAKIKPKVTPIAVPPIVSPSVTP